MQRLAGDYRRRLSQALRTKPAAMKNFQKRAPSFSRRAKSDNWWQVLCRGGGADGAQCAGVTRDPRVAGCVVVASVAVLCSLHLHLGVDTHAISPNLSSPPAPSTSSSSPYHPSDPPATSFFQPSPIDSPPASCPHHSGQHQNYLHTSTPADLPLLLSYLYPALASPPPPLLFHFVLYSTGRLLLRGGDGDASEHAVPASVGDELPANAYLQKARESQEDGDLTNAARLLNKALAVDPANVEAMSRLGFLQEFEFNDLDAAESLYAQALSHRPTDVSLVYDFAVFQTERRNAHDKAQALYDKALQMSPGDAVVLNNYAVFMREVRSDPAAAEALFTKAMEADPTSGSTICNFASLLESDPARLSQARNMYERAVALEPEEASTLYNYAIFLEERCHESPAAADLYRRVLMINPEDNDALNNYALLRQNHYKDFEEAKALFLRALAVDPVDLATINNLGVLHEDCLADYSEAEQFYKRALALAPKDVTSLCNYGGFLRYSKHDPLAAAAVLEQARHLDPIMAEQLISAQQSRTSDENVEGRGSEGVGTEVQSSTGEKTGTFLRH